ncbi:unnamed protein product [Hapterophycus canaliculatus]
MAAVRQDMVKRAVGFLRHPKVKDAPQEKQIAFLKDKNLTKQEIDEALRKAAELGTAEASAKARAALISAPTKRLYQGRVRSEAVVSSGMVFISGQTAWSSSTTSSVSSGTEEELGQGDAAFDKSLSAEQQAAKALARIDALLEKAGSSSSKVVSALLCVRDLGQDLPGVDKAWGRWMDRDNPPARTVVQTGAVAVGGAVGSRSKNREQGEMGGVRVSVSVTAHL